jgi:hypothetical protein
LPTYWAIDYIGQFLIMYNCSPNFWAIFSYDKSYELISTKIWLGYILGDFQTNSSGHPACLVRTTGLKEIRFVSEKTFRNPNRPTTRVARCYIFKPKIPIWVNFRGPWDEKVSYVLWPFGIFYGHLVI